MKDIKLKYEPRPEQDSILEFVKDSIDKEKKFMMIDAPTGVGKSYAAVMIAEWYRKEINEDAKFDIVTNTKLLQDQYTNDFEFMASLKGNNNYWCSKHKMQCGEAKILTRLNDKKCGRCPHTIAQQIFLNERIGLTNFHLLTAYSMYSPDILATRSANVLIIDEAHSFEETFCDFISSTFSEKSLTNLGIWEPWMEGDLDKIDNIRALSSYVSGTIIPRLQNHIADLLDDAMNSRGKKKSDAAKKADHCDKSMCKYNRFINDEANYEKNWVFEKDTDHSNNNRILVEPIWGHQYLKEMFWDKYDHVIFMSGTIVDKEMMAYLMGLDEDEYTYLSLPCPFRVENRPIIYLKFGKMSYYNRQETFKTAIPVIKKILEKNVDNKGIIHSGNYLFSDWIDRNIKDKRLLIHTTKTRESSLEKHLRSENDTVLVSPSMMNGIDLKDDLSRFQIIVKVPFPNLKSTKIKRRLDSKPEWYNWKSLIEIMQSYGRSIRNDDDWAETYVLDTCFDQVLNKNIPEYFRDAIKVKTIG